VTAPVCAHTEQMVYDSEFQVVRGASVSGGSEYGKRFALSHEYATIRLSTGTTAVVGEPAKMGTGINFSRWYTFSTFSNFQQ